jgi:hypothetical protein
LADIVEKSKIERHQKSRENPFVIASNAATLFGADSSIGGRFSVKRCAPEVGVCGGRLYANNIP